MNAIALVFGGITSCLLSGKIADKYEPVSYRAKSFVSATMCFIAVPLCLALFLIHSSFYLSVSLLFLYDLLCLGYAAPVIAMIQGVVDVKKKGAALGAFSFTGTYTSAIANFAIGYLIQKYDLARN